MSIKLYTGRMGSGKSYEVVTEVILGAVRRGRRVVSNIAGLNVEAMHALLIAEGVDAEKLGSVVTIEHEDVTKADFWRTDSSGGSEPESFIQPGDLLALDEIWRFWGGLAKVDSEGKKRPPSVMNFFRMHRHFIHEKTGVACDVALITQDVMDLSRDVRSVVEETYYMEKLTAIGSSKRYRVDVHQGGKKGRKPLLSLQRSYKAELFPLYSSHSQKKEGGASAVEENIDGRGNILRGVIFKVVLPLMIPLMIGAVWLVWGFFHPAEKGAVDASKEKTKQSLASGAASSAQSVPASAPPAAEKWHVTGWYMVGDVLRVVLSDGVNTRYLVAPPNTKITALSIEVELPEGGFATSWTGGKSEGNFLQGPKS